MFSATLVVLLASWGFASAVNTGNEGVNEKHQGRTIGGIDASIGDFNFVVSVQYCPTTSSCTHRETGAILSVNRVITAKNLISGIPFTQLRVLYGSSSSTGTTLATVGSVTLHPTENIAILALGSSLVFGPTVGPVTLPSQTSFMLLSTQYTILGWGSSTGTLQNLQLIRMTAPLVCPFTLPLLSNVFCALSGLFPIVQVCPADEGAPLALGRTLYGIASRPTPILGSCTTNPRFTSIIKIRSFIQQNCC